ncbi:MAG: hypothetical protein ACYC2G_07185 [Gemmatimonadaceae bacterium]
MISRPVVLSLAAVAILSSCGAGAHAASDAAGHPTLSGLAVGWSGGQGEPRCQDHGPRGEYLGGMGDQYCEWVPPAGSGVVGSVSAHANALGRPTMLTWERPARDAADADRIIDSLGTALTGYGLAGRDCGVGSDPGPEIRGFIWESQDLVVFLSRITPEGGVPRLMAMVFDIPSAVPDMACPRPQPS